MELTSLYLVRVELTLFKQAYVKMYKENICMGCSEYFDYIYSYAMIEHDLNMMFHGHKNCLSIVLKQVKHLKERYGIDKVVETINETK